MPFDGFVHPALAIGALLAAVPLLIHLFNRQRHQPLAWAAMRFVLAAYRRTRRRAQIENLVLLLLRMGAVALLALAVARPFTGRDSPLAPLTESRRDVLVLLDGSASTGYRDGVESVFESILRRAREIFSELDGTRGDRARLILAGDHPRLLSTRSPEDALSLLSTLVAPTDEALDLAALLGEVVSLAEEEAAGSGSSGIEVRLLTDLQRRSFSGAESPPEPAEPPFDEGDDGDGAAPRGEGDGLPPIVAALDRLQELGVRVVVEDMGAPLPTPPNLGIESVEPLRAVLGAGIPTEIAVRVQNHGSSGRSGVRVALEVDGERLSTLKADVAARGTTEVVFPVSFREGGQHVLEAELEGDRLAVDDARSKVLFVPPPTRVLLVNGDPADEIERDEIGYLRTVLDPPRDDALGGLPGSAAYVPFVTRVLTSMAFGGSELDLTEEDVIVLANVGPLSPALVERLETWVAAGGALLFTLGDHAADPSSIDAWNARLWRADGSGLLPGRLVRATQLPRHAGRYLRAAHFDAEHPALRFFADERWKPLLTEVPFYGFVATEPWEGTRVLARLDDEARSPLLLERDYDRGRVLLWTSSIDRGWNRVPESPGTFIPLVHELLRHAGRRPESPRNVGVGSSLTAEVSAFPRSPFLVRPDGTRTPLDGEPEALSAELWRLPASPPVDEIGTWRVELEGGPAVVFAVELAAGEGDLDRIGAQELEAGHAVWSYFDEAGPEATADEEVPERGELWRWFALLTLLFLVGETLWAAWIGRSRRVA